MKRSADPRKADEVFVTIFRELVGRLPEIRVRLESSTVGQLKATTCLPCLVREEANLGPGVRVPNRDARFPESDAFEGPSSVGGPTGRERAKGTTEVECRNRFAVRFEDELLLHGARL